MDAVLAAREKQQIQQGEYEKSETNFVPTPLCNLARSVRMDLLIELGRRHPSLSAQDAALSLQEDALQEHLRTLCIEAYRIDVSRRVLADIIDVVATSQASVLGVEGVCLLSALRKMHGIPPNVGATLGVHPINDMYNEAYALDAATIMSLDPDTIGDEALWPVSGELQREARRLVLRMQAAGTQTISLQRLQRHPCVREASQPLTCLAATRLAFRALCLVDALSIRHDFLRSVAPQAGNILPELSTYLVGSLLRKYDIPLAERGEHSAS